MKPLVFVGSNKNLLQMIDIAKARGLQIAGVVDKDYSIGTTLCGLSVIGSEDTFDFSQYVCFNAVNSVQGKPIEYRRNNEKRARIGQLINTSKLECINLVHPTALVASTAVIGVGNLIGAYAIIANNVVIKNHCQIREQSYIAHGVTLNDEVVLQAQSYVGADINVGTGSFIGIKGTLLSYNGTGGCVDSGFFLPACKRKLV